MSVDYPQRCRLLGEYVRAPVLCAIYVHVAQSAGRAHVCTYASPCLSPCLTLPFRSPCRPSISCRIIHICRHNGFPTYCLQLHRCARGAYTLIIAFLKYDTFLKCYRYIYASWRPRCEISFPLGNYRVWNASTHTQACTQAHTPRN